MKRIRMVGKLKGKTHAELAFASVESGFYRLAHVDIRKVNDVPRESALRLYCSQSGTTWDLQVRGPVRNVDGQEGKDFIVATGALSVADMRTLRDSIDFYLMQVP